MKEMHDRFWEKVKIAGPDECWLWQAGMQGNYGTFQISQGNGASYSALAHRVAWELATEWPIPEGMFVCHHCDVPLCVNPNHLYLGTAQDNSDDCGQKGRRPEGLDLVPWESRPRGETHYEGKLLEWQVIAIRMRLAAGETQVSVAKEYKVRQSLVSRIGLGTVWAHVGGPRIGLRHHKLTPEERAEVQRRAALGENREALAQMFQVKVRAIYNCINRTEG